MDLETLSISVFGNVQGVFYRQSARDKARELGITGKVMNMEDGTVSIIATGAAEQLNKFIEWCRQGPPRANVTNIEIKKIEFEKSDEFIISR